MDYISPDDITGSSSYVEVTAKAVPQRNLWLFLCCTIVPIILVIGGVTVLQQIQQSRNSQAKVTIAGEQALALDLSAPAVAMPQADGAFPAATKAPDVVKPITVTVRRKDSLGKIFKRVGLDGKSAATILSLKKAKELRDLHAGKKLSLMLDPTKTKLQTLEYSIDILNTLIVTAAAKGGWSVETRHVEPKTNTKYAAATINGSIYLAGKKAGVPRKLMAELVNAFGNKINVKKICDGDRFALFYKEYTINGQKVKESEIAAAELIHKGETHRLISFTDSYGNTNFYTPSGYNLKPLFDRYPIAFKRIGSHFSHARHHPILDVTRPHLGVDLVANTGTPIKATSSGRIVFAGNKNGYGRAVIIKNGIYDTLYAHLSRFADKVYSGGYIKKGQVIGYVGSSGLSTSPHLHYEFHVNGVPKDPLKVKLPIGEMIASEHRQSFFAVSKKLLAQLDMQRKNHKVFAATQKPSA